MALRRIRHPGIRAATPSEVRAFAKGRTLSPGRTTGRTPAAAERVLPRRRGPQRFMVTTLHGTPLGIVSNFAQTRRLLEQGSDAGIFFTRTRRRSL